MTVPRDHQPCLFCGGDPSQPYHDRYCDGKQGRQEADQEDREDPDYDPRSHARGSDPDTSHEAAWAVDEETATAMQRAVLAIHKAHPEGLTDEQLLACWQREYEAARSLESKASPRKRRSDLARMGLLVDSGERRALVSGRRGVVWKVAS